MLEDETPADSYARNLALALRGHDALKARLEALGDAPVARYLHHVVSTVPYYRQRHSRPARSVRPFEMVQRECMRALLDDFRSDCYRQDCETLVIQTNGTLSPALKVAFDLAGFYEAIYFSFARIIETRPRLWDVLESGSTSVVLVSDDPDQLRFTSCVPSLRFSLMRRLPLYRSDANEEAVVDYLRANRVPILYGKPHTLLRLADLDERLSRGSQRIRPQMLLVAGENLYDSDRVRLTEWFGVEIINAYTSSEGGLIAVDCPRQRNLHVQSDRLIVEVLKPDGTLGGQGTGELVITNLMNWGQAFVRYRQDDIVTLSRGRCPCGFSGPTISKLSGRDAEEFDVPGIGKVTATSLSQLFADHGLRQYEVAQEQGGILSIRWIASAGTDVRATQRRLTGRLRKSLGKSFTLTRVSDITVPGGKLRRFVRK